MSLKFTHEIKFQTLEQHATFKYNGGWCGTN